MKKFLKTIACVITCFTVMTSALCSLTFAEEEHGMGCLPEPYDDLRDSHIETDLENAGYDVIWLAWFSRISVNLCIVCDSLDQTFDEIESVFSDYGFVVTLDESGDKNNLSTNDMLLITKPENNLSGFTWSGTIMIRGDCAEK